MKALAVGKSKDDLAA
ncbi:hypothetical protein [Lentibacter sp. XHP0401]